MATISNSLTNLIKNQFVSEGADIVIKDVDAVQRLLTTMANSAASAGNVAPTLNAVTTATRELIAAAAQSMGQPQAAGGIAQALGLGDIDKIEQVNVVARDAAESWKVFSESEREAASSGAALTQQDSILYQLMQTMSESAFNEIWPIVTQEMKKTTVAAAEMQTGLSGTAIALQDLMQNQGMSMKDAEAIMMELGKTTEQLTAAETELGLATANAVKPTIELASVRGMNITQYKELTAAQTQSIAGWIKEGLSLQEMTLLSKEAGISTGQLKQALADLGVTIDGATQAGDRYTQGIGAQIREGRAFRYGGLEVMAVFSMMSMVLGEDVPNSMKAMEKSMMLISSGGLMTAMFGLGSGVGLVAGLFASLAIMAFGVDDSVQALNKSFDQMAKKDDLINTLSQVLNISKDDATALDELAKKSSAVAAALKEVIDNSRPLDTRGQFLAALTDATAWDMIITKLKGVGSAAESSIPGVQGLANVLQKIADVTFGPGMAAEEQLRALRAASAAQDAVDAQQKQDRADALIEVQKEGNDLLKYEAQLNQQAADAYKTKTDAETKALQTLNDANDKAARTRTEAFANADKATTESMIKLGEQQNVQNMQNAQRWTNINDTLRDSEYKAWQSYNDKLHDAAISRNDKLADEDHNYQKSLQSLQDQQVKDAYDLAYKLYQIERDREQKLYDLDFTTALDLSKAKTENDKDEIEWRAMNQRAAINRNADNEREDALNRLQQQLSDLTTRKKNLDDEYAYRKMVIEREYDQELAKAQRTFQEQTAEAIKSFNDQVAAQRNAEAVQAAQRENQIADIQRQNTAAKESAKQRYADETADAQKRYSEEIKAAQTTYDDAIQKIKNLHDAKVKELQDEWNAFLATQTAKEKALMQELAIRQAIANAAISAGFSGGGISGGGGGGGASGFGQAGMDMVVPAGYGHDNYNIAVSSGEHVKVEPNAASSSVAYITVEPVMQSMVASLMNQLVSSGMLKEGVKIVLNDSVFQG